MDKDLTKPERGFYYHYKHDTAGALNNYAYEVHGLARHTEDKSFLVLYKPLYESEWFKPADYQARPLSVFLEQVTYDGKTLPRFSCITDPIVIQALENIKAKMYGSTAGS